MRRMILLVAPVFLAAFAGVRATESWRAARPTLELGHLDALVAHRSTSADVRERVVRIRAGIRVVDLRMGVLRDYRALRDSVAAVLRDVEPVVAEARASERRQQREIAATVNAVGAAGLLLDGVPLDPAARGALTEARVRTAEAAELLASGRWGSARSAASAAAARMAYAHEGARARVGRYADEGTVAQWTGWITEAVAHSRVSGGPAVVVDKDARRLTVYRGGLPVSIHRVDLGSDPLSSKLRQGDGATPEGRYRVVERKERGRSRYGQALLLDYPNADDLGRLRRAIADGLVAPGTSPGGLIEIHGGGGRGEDWTDGCVALADHEMAAVFDAIPLGTPVVIVGGDGTGPWARLARRLAP